MQFGKTLVGGIIGAALGIGLLIAVYLVAGIDKMWMAVPVAILTGLGVRMVAAKGAQDSYLRGAITVLLAMGAYLGGLAITKAVANSRTASVAKAAPKAAVEAGDADQTDKATGDEAAAPPPQVAAEPMKPVVPDGGLRRPSMPNQFSTWDFLSLAAAALVAYVLGSSGAARRPVDDHVSGEPVAMATHPDA